MKKSFVQCLAVVTFILSATLVLQAQGDTSKTPAASTPTGAPPTITATTAPIDLARAALAAQGGEKFKSLKSMVLKGSVDLYAPNSTQSIPGSFVIVTAGEKVRIEISAPPAINFKQIFDGQQSYSSIPNVQLPPASKFGPIVLTRLDQPGYAVTAIADKKKLRGFRVADSDGNVTDFYIDPATGRIMSFLIPFGGYTFGTENKKFKELEGILIATSFTQRLEMPQGAFFADYSVKDIKLNQPIGDDVFAIP